MRRHLRPESARAGLRVRWDWIGATAATVPAIGWVVAHQMSLPVWWSFAGDSKSVLAPSKDDLTAAAKECRAQGASCRSPRKKEQEVRKRDPIAALASGSGKSARHRLTDGSPCPFCPEMVAVPAGRCIMGSVIEAALQRGAGAGINWCGVRSRPLRGNLRRMGRLLRRWRLQRLQAGR